jgi:hypothetical protein
MANVNRIITLTSKGNSSGPLYDVYYSLNCISYSLCVDGNDVNLPTVGATATVTLPEESTCLKLINLSAGCNNNEVVQFLLPTTTTTAGPTTTTTTISGSTTTTTTTAGSTTTTTTFGPVTKVVAHNCQDYYDFNTYCVQSSSTPAIGDVYRDSYGTCYTVSSIPIDQTLPCVGNLYLVGGPGTCSSSLCVTTTTTEAPFCHTWLVENNTGAGYYFKYMYCGQNTFTYLEVPAFDSRTVCVQNDRIFNSFVAPLTFTDLNTNCIGTTSTTTTIPPQVLFTAANCQNIYDNNTYSANSASYSVGDVFIDDYGTCYYILNFSGEAPVGRLTFVGASGSCSSPTCVTTTTTQAPFCNTWVVENVSENSAGEIYKVKYCGDNFFSYPQVYFGYPQTVCVQNDEISNPFFNRVALTNLSQSCQTTTTTTLAPGCSTFVITNNGDFFTYVGDYVYCGNNFSSSYSVGTNSTVRLCVQDGKIDLPSGFNYVIQISGSCNATTTTTTTLAPGCYLATIINNNIGTTFLGDYVYCGTSVSQSFEVASGTSASFCTQDQKIDLPSGPNYTSSFSAVGGCAATTTTTTTLAPGCYLATIVNNNIGTTWVGEYVYCGSSVSQSFSVASGTSASFCTQDKKIDLPPSASYYTSSFSAVGGCAATTTTTTTLAPGCYLATIINNNIGTTFVGNYVYCGNNFSSSFSVASGTSGSFCTQDKKIDLPSGPNYTSSFSAVGGCTTSTTTTTTLPPAFTNIWTADAWFDNSGLSITVDYTGSNGLYTSSVI